MQPFVLMKNQKTPNTVLFNGFLHKKFKAPDVCRIPYRLQTTILFRFLLWRCLWCNMFSQCACTAKRNKFHTYPHRHA